MEKEHRQQQQQNVQINNTEQKNSQKKRKGLGSLKNYMKEKFSSKSPKQKKSEIDNGSQNQQQLVQSLLPPLKSKQRQILIGVIGMSLKKPEGNAHIQASLKKEAGSDRNSQKYTKLRKDPKNIVYKQIIQKGFQGGTSFNSSSIVQNFSYSNRNRIKLQPLKQNQTSNLQLIQKRVEEMKIEQQKLIQVKFMQHQKKLEQKIQVQKRKQINNRLKTFILTQFEDNFNGNIIFDPYPAKDWKTQIKKIINIGKNHQKRIFSIVQIILDDAINEIEVGRQVNVQFIFDSFMNLIQALCPNQDQKIKNRLLNFILKFFFVEKPKDNNAVALEPLNLEKEK